MCLFFLSRVCIFCLSSPNETHSSSIIITCNFPLWMAPWTPYPPASLLLLFRSCIFFFSSEFFLKMVKINVQGGYRSLKSLSAHPAESIKRHCLN